MMNYDYLQSRKPCPCGLTQQELLQKNENYLSSDMYCLVINAQGQECGNHLKYHPKKPYLSLFSSTQNQKSQREVKRKRKDSFFSILQSRVQEYINCSQMMKKTKYNAHVSDESIYENVYNTRNESKYESKYDDNDNNLYEEDIYSNYMNTIEEDDNWKIISHYSPHLYKLREGLLRYPEYFQHEGLQYCLMGPEYNELLGDDYQSIFLYQRSEIQQMNQRLNFFMKETTPLNLMIVSGANGIGKSRGCLTWAMNYLQKDVSKGVIWINVVNSSEINCYFPYVIGNESLVSSSTPNSDQITIKAYQIYIQEFINWLKNYPNLQVIIFDNITHQNKWILNLYYQLCYDLNIKMIGITSSLDFTLNLTTNYSYFTPQTIAYFQLFSWKLEDYQKACCYCYFRTSIQSYFDVEGYSSQDFLDLKQRTRMIVDKYYLVGRCARWMFQRTIQDLIQSNEQGYLDQLLHSITGNDLRRLLLGSLGLLSDENEERNHQKPTAYSEDYSQLIASLSSKQRVFVSQYIVKRCCSFHSFKLLEDALYFLTPDNILDDNNLFKLDFFIRLGRSTIDKSYSWSFVCQPLNEITSDQPNYLKLYSGYHIHWFVYTEIPSNSSLRTVNSLINTENPLVPSTIIGKNSIIQLDTSDNNNQLCQYDWFVPKIYHVGGMDSIQYDSQTLRFVYITNNKQKKCYIDCQWIQQFYLHFQKLYEEVVTIDTCELLIVVPMDCLNEFIACDMIIYYHEEILTMYFETNTLHVIGYQRKVVG